MATIPEGIYNCEFESQAFVVYDNANPEAEIPVNYSEEFISINYGNDEYTIGVGDIELMSRDGYNLANSVEVAGSSLDIGTYFIDYLPSGQLSFDLESIGEIRLVFDGDTLKVYTR